MKEETTKEAVPDLARPSVPDEFKLTPGGIAALACSLEVSAPKPGNVHRGADFEDTTFNDFLVSAVVLGQVLDQFANAPLGETILQAVKATSKAVGTNTNLGMVLLLSPLAKVAAIHRDEPLGPTHVSELFESLDPADGGNVFEAIRVAKPSGLGEVSEMNVLENSSQSVDLLEAMKLGSDRDSIARQYVSGFRNVFDLGVNFLIEGQAIWEDLSSAIVYCHVAWMAHEPDSLIARKCGTETAKKSQVMAAKAIDQIKGRTNELAQEIAVEQREAFWVAVSELDFWLRSDGHRRNPGTTADLVAASLFVAINNGAVGVNAI